MIIVPVPTAMVRLPPREYLDAYSLHLAVGERMGIDDMRRQLEHSGYRHVSQVMEHGEYCVRGSLFDLFPMGSDRPYRIDLLDDEIDTIRTFDPETQLSTEQVDTIHLMPAREFPSIRKLSIASARASAASSPAIRSARRCIAMSATASRRPASNTICRCSSSGR